MRWWRSGELVTWPNSSSQLTLLLTNPKWPTQPAHNQSAPYHPLLFKGWKGQYPLFLCCQVSPLTWCLLLVSSGPAFSYMMEEETHSGDAICNAKGQIFIWFNSVVIEVAWASCCFQLWVINKPWEKAYLWGATLWGPWVSKDCKLEIRDFMQTALLMQGSSYIVLCYIVCCSILVSVNLGNWYY